MNSNEQLVQELNSLKCRVQKMEALEGVRDVFTRYSLYADLGQWNKVSTLFSDDGILQIVGYGNYAGINYDGEFRSRSRIIEYYDEVLPDVLPKNKHNIIPKTIKFDNSDQFKYAYLIAYLVGADNQAGGVYEAVLERRSDQTWCFLKLRCVNASKLAVQESIVGIDKISEDLDAEFIEL